jgi:hypothetical protein
MAVNEGENVENPSDPANPAAGSSGSAQSADHVSGLSESHGTSPNAARVTPTRTVDGMGVLVTGLLAFCAAAGAFIVFAPRFDMQIPHPLWGLAVLVLVLVTAVAILGLRRLSDPVMMAEAVIPSIGKAITGTFGAVLIIGGLSFWFIYSVVQNNQVTGNDFSRGLITVTFTFGTMLTAFVLVLTALFGGTDRTQSTDPQVIEADAKAVRELLKARFDMGKEVLGLLIGIFGTILGFYFGSSSDDTVRRRAMSAIEALGGEINGTTVRLMKPQVGNADLSELRRLPKVERLWLDYSWVTPAGIVPLYDLKDLSELHLTGTADPKVPVQALVKELKDEPNFKNLKVYPEVEKLPSGTQVGPATPVSTPTPPAPVAQQEPPEAQVPKPSTKTSPKGAAPRKGASSSATNPPSKSATPLKVSEKGNTSETGVPPEPTVPTAANADVETKPAHTQVKPGSPVTPLTPPASATPPEAAKAQNPKSDVETSPRAGAPQKGATSSATNPPSKPATTVNDPESVKPPEEEAPPAPANRGRRTGDHLEKRRMNPMSPPNTLSTRAVSADGAPAARPSSTASRVRAVRSIKATGEGWKLAQDRVVIRRIRNPSHGELVSRGRLSEL